MYETQFLTSLAQLDTLAEGWDALASQWGSPTSSRAWYRCALESVHGPAESVNVIAVRQHGQLAAVVPLVLTTAGGAPRYELAGTRRLYEPTEILARPEAVPAVVKALVELPYPVSLVRLAPGDFTEAFERHARGAGIVLTPKASGSPYVDLAGDWSAYYKRLPGKLRNMLRRAARQLSKQGEVRIECLRPEPSKALALLHEAFEVEQRSWKGRAGSAVLQRPDLSAFFLRYGLALAQRGQLLISTLRLDDKPVAVQVANLSAGSYWQLKIGYDESLARQLVGLQLQLETLRWSFSEGLRRYEFLGTCEPWIEEWTSASRSYRTLVFYPWSVRGMGAFVRDNLGRVRSRLRRP